MGWREREYAQLTPRERRRMYGTSGRSCRRRGSATFTLLVVLVGLFGMFVLPHLSIHGHHYRFFVF